MRSVPEGLRHRPFHRREALARGVSNLRGIFGGAVKRGLMSEAALADRMNGMIAIMKDIEKNQTKPTVAMLQSLFEQVEPKYERPLMIEKKRLVFEKENPGKTFSDNSRVSAVEKSKSKN